MLQCEDAQGRRLTPEALACTILTHLQVSQAGLLFGVGAVPFRLCADMVLTLSLLYMCADPWVSQALACKQRCEWPRPSNRGLG